MVVPPSEEILVFCSGHDNDRGQVHHAAAIPTPPSQEHERPVQPLSSLLQDRAPTSALQRFLVLSGRARVVRHLTRLDHRLHSHHILVELPLRIGTQHRCQNVAKGAG